MVRSQLFVALVSESVLCTGHKQLEFSGLSSTSEVRHDVSHRKLIIYRAATYSFQQVELCSVDGCVDTQPDI